MSTAINVEEHIGLVKSIAKKYNGIDYCEYEDLVQVGCVALIKAANSFDESKGFKFSTLAASFIHGSIKTYIRDFSNKRVSGGRLIYELSMKIKKCEKELGGNATKESVCKHLSIDTFKYDECLKFLDLMNIYSLDYTIDMGENRDIVFHETVKSNKRFEEDIEMNDALSIAIKYLSEKQKKIVYLTYWKELSQSEIGEILGINQVQVSRELRKALNIMKDVIA